MNMKRRDLTAIFPQCSQQAAVILWTFAVILWQPCSWAVNELRVKHSGPSASDVFAIRHNVQQRVAVIQATAAAEYEWADQRADMFAILRALHRILSEYYAYYIRFVRISLKGTLEKLSDRTVIIYNTDEY